MMPTVAQETVPAWAHCGTPTCPGSRQVEVKGLRVETSFMFTDNGGDIPGVERSMVTFQFADEADRACPDCERPREVSGQHRPSYDPLSGFDPMGLVGADQFDGRKVNTEADAEVAALRAQVAEQAKKLDALLDKLGGGD